jgi:hypothetical protein
MLRAQLWTTDDFAPAFQRITELASHDFDSPSDDGKAAQTAGLDLVVQVHSLGVERVRIETDCLGSA